MQHWKEDFMFGYQFLNGCNPIMFQKCFKLPDKFPVTHKMVSVSLERELTLEQEIEVNNVGFYEPIQLCLTSILPLTYNADHRSGSRQVTSTSWTTRCWKASVLTAQTRALCSTWQLRSVCFTRTLRTRSCP